MKQQSPEIELMMRGMALKDIRKLSDKTMEAVYATAYRFYMAHNIAKATELFRFLCIYDHLNLKYVLGLAACYQLSRKYDHAIELYSRASLLDAEDPRPPFHAAKCYLSLGQLTKAESGFFAAQGWAKKSPKHQDIYQESTRMLELVQNRIKGGRAV